jgi:hypothetical protein
MKKWRVKWFENGKIYNRYYKKDKTAIKKHIQNLTKFKVFRAWLYWYVGLPRMKYRLVGGCDCLLGLIRYPPDNTGEYYEKLIEEIEKELRS